MIETYRKWFILFIVFFSGAFMIGMNTYSFVSSKIEQNSYQNRKFKKLVKTNFEKTRHKLILQDQSNTFKEKESGS